MTYQNFWLTNVVFDGHRTCGIRLNANGGTIVGMHATAVWLNAWEASGIIINGPTTNEQHDFTQMYILLAGLSGVVLQGPNAKKISISDSIIEGVGRSDFAAGVSVSTLTKFSIINCQGGDDTTYLGIPWRPYAGISISGNSDLYTVTNNNLTGFGANFELVPNTTSSKNRIIKNNLNANYAVNQVIALPASGVAYENKNGYSLEANVFGGTVTNVSKNGIQVGASGTTRVQIDPGDSLVLAYSVAPTVSWFGLN